MSDLSIAGAEAEGFTHIEARCSCGWVVAMPFRLLLIRRQAVAETPLARVATRMRCERCGSAPATWRPWRQYLDGSVGYAWGKGHSD